MTDITAFVQFGIGDDVLKDAVFSVARSSSFKYMVDAWAKFTGKGKFNWDLFLQKLEMADFIKPENATEYWQALGWAGKNKAGEWLLALGYKGTSPNTATVQHELFHLIDLFGNCQVRYFL
jgi:hypothetical protein